MNGPRNLVLAVMFVILASGFSAAATAANIYIAQNAAGGNTGADCADAFAVSWFNSSANWGSGAAQIGPGVTVHLCGTFNAPAGASGYLTFQGGGNSSSPVTLLFESGAVLTAPYWGGNGAILGTSNYTLVDGGTNGLITATANGTGLANQVSNTTAVVMYNASNSEVRNLTITNLYVHSANLSDTADGTQGARGAIYFYNASNGLVHGNTIHDTGTCIRLGYSTNSNFQAYGNTCYNINWGIIVGDNGGGDSLTGLVAVYNNDIHDFAPWDQTDNFNHHDGIYFFATNTGSSFSGGLIYNNFIHGDPGEYTNTFIFTSDDPSHTCGGHYIFNNVLVNTSGTTNDTPANGLVQDWCVGDFVYNNTMLGIMQSSTNPENNSNPGMNVNPGTNITIENDILELFRNGWGIGGSGSISASDYNDYYNNGDLAWDRTNTAYHTLSSLQGCHSNGCPAGTHDTNSAAGDPLLTGTYHLTGASSAAWQTGKNLYSVCNGQPNPGLGALCYDKAGVQRPSTANWDMGAYEDSSASGAAPSPPTGLNAQVQ